MWSCADFVRIVCAVQAQVANAEREVQRQHVADGFRHRGTKDVRRPRRGTEPPESLSGQTPEKHVQAMLVEFLAQTDRLLCSLGPTVLARPQRKTRSLKRKMSVRACHTHTHLLLLPGPAQRRLIRCSRPSADVSLEDGPDIRTDFLEMCCCCALLLEFACVTVSVASACSFQTQRCCDMS